MLDEVYVKFFGCCKYDWMKKEVLVIIDLVNELLKGDMIVKE